MSEWIRVEDRLPNDLHEVLVYWIGPEYSEVIIATLYHGGWSEAGKGGLCLPNVTHWQPLPDPPPPDE